MSASEGQGSLCYDWLDRTNSYINTAAAINHGQNATTCYFNGGEK